MCSGMSPRASLLPVNDLNREAKRKIIEQQRRKQQGKWAGLDVEEAGAFQAGGGACLSHIHCMG